MKETTPKQFWIATFLIIVGVGLLVAGFVCPPVAAIHPSVLTAFGEILTFSGSVIGIDYHYRFKYPSDKKMDS